MSLHKVLSNLAIFANLEEKDLQVLLKITENRKYEAQNVVFAEGEIGNAMYIILKGAIRITKSLGEADEQELAIRKVGELIGEMALLEDKPRSATGTAISETELLVLHREDFHSLLYKNPQIVLEIIKTLSRRLRESDEHTIKFLQNKNLELEIAYQKLASSQKELQRKNIELEEALEALRKAQSQLIEQERMKQELLIGHKIQQKLLPENDPNITGFEIFGISLSAYEVGGDFYRYMQLEDDLWAIAIGDVSGKGVSAALFMALSCCAVEAGIRFSDNPSQFLHQVNDLLIPFMIDSPMNTALQIAYLNTKTKEISLANAALILPLLYEKQKEKANFIKLESGFPVGVLSDEYNIAYQFRTITLQKGDILVLSTDGIVETMNAKDELFGHIRFIKALEQYKDLSTEQLKDGILAEIEHFKGDAPQHDDITLVILRCLE